MDGARLDEPALTNFREPKKMMMKVLVLVLALHASDARQCEDSASWHKNGNTAKDCSWVSRFAPTRCSVKGENKVRASEACPATCDETCDACDVDAVELADFEVWRREEGYWWGEYTFLGAEGDPFVSSSWNYGDDQGHTFN